jgi:hypothetical protein
MGVWGAEFAVDSRSLPPVPPGGGAVRVGYSARGRRSSPAVPGSLRGSFTESETQPTPNSASGSGRSIDDIRELSGLADQTTRVSRYVVSGPTSPNIAAHSGGLVSGAVTVVVHTDVTCRKVALPCQ